MGRGFAAPPRIATALRNKSFEALVSLPDAEPCGVIALHEINVLPLRAPSALAIDCDLERAVQRVEMNPVLFRLTAATESDSSGRFWAISYAITRGQRVLRSRATFGLYRRASTPRIPTRRSVERLVELQYLRSETGEQLIRRTKRPPVYLRSRDDDGASRNWEGLARWDANRLLLITDRYPKLSSPT